MKNLLCVIGVSILIVIFAAGCSKDKTLPTQTDDIAGYFCEDDKFGIHGLEWNESADNVRTKLGEINEAYSMKNDYREQIVPNELFVFQEFNLETEATVYRFNEEDQLFRIEYYFPLTDETTAMDTMDQIIAKLNANGYEAYEYRYLRGNSIALIDYVTQTTFEIPTAIWTDADGTTLTLTVDTMEKKFRLAMALQRKRT